jgi:PleD family two-component response regulator
MPSREYSLLLVDDDPAAIRIMSRMLSDYPAQRFATSGEDALRMAHETTPDLILLDVDMPGMSGFEICMALKEDAGLSHVPIIFVTGMDEPGVELAALECGGSDFIAKPLDPEQLAARVAAKLHTRDVRPATAEAGDPPRMLIVDDDITAIHVLRHAIEDMGEFHFATSGEEALRLTRSLLPDLIFLDLHMPDMNGFAVCASLKANTAFTHIPVVFVTRFADPQSEMLALELGAAEFVSKPFTPAVLRTRVRNLLSLKRRTDAGQQLAASRWKLIDDAQLARIVALAPDAVLSSDASGTVVLANAAACALFDAATLTGRPAAELLGDAWAQPEAGPGGTTRCTLPPREGAPIEVDAWVWRSTAADAPFTTFVLRTAPALKATQG